MNSNGTRINYRNLRYIIVVLSCFISGCFDDNSSEDRNDVAPAITASISPSANERGWHNSSVIVTFHCSDQHGEVSFCSPPIEITSEGKNQSVTGTGKYLDGNENSITMQVSIDKTKPTLNAEYSAEPASGSWIVEPLTITYSYSDELSGIYEYPKDEVIDEGGRRKVISAKVEDLAGNVAVHNNELNIDLESPEIKVVSPINNSYTLETTAVLEIQFTDDVEILSETFKYQINQQFVFPICEQTSANLLSCTFDKGLNLGENVFLISGTDISGKNSETHFTLNVGKTPDGGDGTPTPDDDNQPPALKLHGASNIETDNSIITVSGQATDNIGISNVVLLSDHYQQQPFTTLIDAEGRFSAEVPVEQGTNSINVIARDAAGNSTSSAISVLRTHTDKPQLEVTNFTSGQTVYTNLINLKGLLVSPLSVDNLSLKLGIHTASLIAIGNNTYEFSFDDISLNEGENYLTLIAESTAGTTALSLRLTYSVDISSAAPALSIKSPLPNSHINQQRFVVQGTIVSGSIIKSFTINGKSVYLVFNGENQYHFNYWAAFRGDSVQLNLIAVAQNGENITEIINYYKDDNAPVINLITNLQPEPIINEISQVPFNLTGTVTDSNISSMTLNDKVIGLSPGSNNNEYQFDIAVNLPRQLETTLIIKAYDTSGNQSQEQYIVFSNSTASVDIIAPSNKSEFIFSESTFNLQILARVNGITDTDKVRITADQNPPIFTDVQQSFVNTSVIIASTVGKHQVVIEVLDNKNNIKIITKREFMLTNEQAVELSVLRTHPENGQVGIEPNDFITLYLSKSIVPDLLSFDVRETANGKTYINNDPSGTSFIEAKGYQLTQISRSNEQVIGSKGLLAGDNVITFYPASDLAYNANVFVTATYDGQELTRFNYKVRPLPTFLSGSISDQLDQLVEGIKVEIPELNRITTTNGDGVFSFGAGDTANESLTGGVYKLVINRDFSNPLFGITERTIAIEQGRQNELSQIKLQLIDQNIAFSPLHSGQNHTLASGELALDLTQAQITFPNGQNGGSAHVSFMEIGGTDMIASAKAFPGWVYAVQPVGISVNGNVKLSIQMPKIYNSYDYVPDNGTYVVLVGRNGLDNSLQPIGVGEINGYKVQSVEGLDLKRLDYIGYAFVADDKQSSMARYAKGELTLQGLIGLL